MIASMTKYSFILLNGEQNELLQQLQELGLVDITRSAKPIDTASEELLTEIDLLDGLIKGLEKAVVPEGTEPEDIDGDIVRLAGGMLMRYTDDADHMERLQRNIDSARIWGSYDPEILRKLNEAGIPIHFHCLSNKLFSPEWAETCPLSVIDTDKANTWFVVAGPDDPLPGEIPAPKQPLEEMEKELADLEKHYAGVLQRIQGAKNRLPELKQRRAETYSKLDLHLAGATAVPAAEDTIVTLVGYAPSENDETVSAALDQSGVFYLKEAATVEDNPPIKLKNKWFVRQFEVLTDMYGRPAYDGFDPTPFISVFFLLFFAFCMGDCGYGLLLLLLGILMKKSEGMKKLSDLVVLLGIGTTVIGFFFHNFFSMDIATWSIFKPISWMFLPSKIAGYDGTMVLAIIVGIVHLSLAMCVKTYEATKKNGFLNSLGTWGWTLLIVGGVIVGGLALIGVLSAALTKWIIIVLGIVSALGIFVFNDLHRNKFANIGMGLWDTYNTATGLLGDVLSYLRLYALGLAGSMLGMAFNSIGLMVLGDGSKLALWPFFLLIVIVGHTLNIAMAVLGAFVHPLRLNFLEFFKNSGYEAGGRNYKPLSK